ncbi:hypothetical protein B0H19DRAFT_1274366 [Mycena capillaripes]|nr:hypothetical protein B0H19DRAFT_1274366 [Mycena capillaripes]
MSFTTLTFDSSKILKSTIHSTDDPALRYTTTTVNKRSSRSRETTALEGVPGTPNAIIDWKRNTFEISGSTRDISSLRSKRSTFSTAKYWSWFDEEEYKVKYAAEAEHSWSLYSYDGTVLATFTTNIHRVFHDNSLPVIHLSPSITDEDERRFIILVLLYSETNRKESLTERPLSIVADFTCRDPAPDTKIVYF